MKTLTSLALALFVSNFCFSQNIGINSTGNNPDNSAMLDVSATDKGVLIPRVALTASNVAGPVTTPATSLLVYNTATAGTAPNNVLPGFYYWDGTNWVRLSTVRGDNGLTNVGNEIDLGGDLNQNTTLTHGTNNLQMNLDGTGDFYVSGNTDANLLYVDGSADFIGIGLNNPTNKLHVVDNADDVDQSVIYARNTNNGAGVSYAIRGEANSTTVGSAGVLGISTNGGQNEIGVAGDYTLWGAGVFGRGWSSDYTDMPVSRDFGVYGVCDFGTGTGVYSEDLRNDATSYASYAEGKTAATGTKSASVPTTQGNQLVYCMESPEIWFEDMGTGKLVNGECHIELDEMFVETVFIDENHPMHVFMQEQGDCNGLYFIPDADGKGFTVKEKNNGQSNITFSFRIMAKRRFYQDHRFGVDAHQPLEDNLSKGKYVEPYSTDINKVKMDIEKANREKEQKYSEQQGVNQQ